MVCAAVEVGLKLAAMCVDIVSASRRLEAKQELGRRAPRNRANELASYPLQQSLRSDACV